MLVILARKSTGAGGLVVVPRYLCGGDPGNPAQSMNG